MCFSKQSVVIENMSTVNPVIRRSHKKSKDGCHNCKKRRIKCDEFRPDWYVTSDSLEVNQSAGNLTRVAAIVYLAGELASIQ